MAFIRGATKVDGGKSVVSDSDSDLGLKRIFMSYINLLAELTIQVY